MYWSAGTQKREFGQFLEIFESSKTKALKTVDCLTASIVLVGISNTHPVTKNRPFPKHTPREILMEVVIFAKTLFQTGGGFPLDFHVSFSRSRKEKRSPRNRSLVVSGWQPISEDRRGDQPNRKKPTL